MRGVSTVPRSERTEIVRTDVREAEQLFGSCLADIACTLWRENTAPKLAAAAGCSVRAAEYYLGGQRDWSGDALAAIVTEILRRHAMRNVKISPRP